jgi:diaminohydroxyphosphoribosylaminopyrimidine deaminase/5-amino-6-(5-phosphoribosylamino)uracil reductase
MAKAIALAKKGCYTTDPNPRVGCILVKHQQIIAEGWHKKAGQNHAEIEALSQANNVQYATVYLTLEPCSHYGKTAPCCDALIRANVARVVVAMQDPNPLVAGKGLEKLRQAGIEVVVGVLEQDARQLNVGFIKRMTQGIPFIRSKLAMSLDGRTAMASGESKWITGNQARDDVQRLRATSSAILTGINTILADDPQLNVRLATEVSPPIRIVLDSRLQMPISAKIRVSSGRCLILTCSNNQVKKHRLEQAGFEVFILAEKQGRLDLEAVFILLAKQQINELLVEAGAILNGALLATGWVDEWVIYLAPVILGDQGRGLFTLPSLQTMADKKILHWQHTRHVGQDLKLTFSR